MPKIGVSEGCLSLSRILSHENEIQDLSKIFFLSSEIAYSLEKS